MTQQELDDLISLYLDDQPHPDWDGLTADLAHRGFSPATIAEILYDVKQGG